MADKIIPFKGYTFDDLLLYPLYSEIRPAEVDLSIQLTPHIKLTTPIISIHMDTLTEDKMAIAMAKLGGLGIIHRNQSIDREATQVKAVKKIMGETKFASVDKKGHLVASAAIGVGDDWLERSQALVKAGADALAIDVSYAYKKNTLKIIENLRKTFPKTDIIAGNIASAEGALALAKAGAHSIKIGIGNGTICTLRIVSGVGVPQLTAVIESKKGVKGTGTTIISDGGTKSSGDMTKAFGAGADAIAVGSLLAGTDETPGEIIENDGIKYKSYRGMGSKAALNVYSEDRYSYKSKSVNSVSQGIEALVLYKGAVSEIVHQLVGGIRSGFGYVGAKTIGEMQEKARFLQITKAGLAESHPFNVIPIKDEPNYKVHK
jgi:IMP dehydrogenase